MSHHKPKESRRANAAEKNNPLPERQFFGIVQPPKRNLARKLDIV